MRAWPVPSGGGRSTRRLSSPLSELQPHYDVVVVGSGYGGAVVAARLAETGQRVCVLERGRELWPGDYPDTLAKALQEVQIDSPSGHLFSPTALFDVRVNPGLTVIVGCGLGGTSLINANVALPPTPDVFADAAWPHVIQQEARDSTLWHWFARAGDVLKPRIDPNAERPRKLGALRNVRRLFGERMSVRLAPVTVSFDAPAGHARQPAMLGVTPGACARCGDCVTGCNYGAKNTLITNSSYLPRARRHGADIFTEMKVRSVERCPDVLPSRWVVTFDHLGAKRERFTSAKLFVTAHTVVLAAGALGSPEILMRSRSEHGLPVSDRLGQHFSGNGDVLAFAYNNLERVNAIGSGARSSRLAGGPGPCISGFLRRGRTPSPILLEDGVIPGALSPILSLGFALARKVRDRSGGGSAGSASRSLWTRVEETLRGGPGATATFLAMVEDAGYGELIRQDDRVRVRWPGAGTGAPYRELESLLRHAATSLRGSYIASPFGPVTVHPLGGCVMAEGPDRGVVDHTGAVFNPDTGAPHPGLYVCDASIIPRALGANPLLTITALAERSAAWMCRP